MTYESGSRVGDYEVVAPLGAGGMGQVYKVRNLISDRLEAMKVLLPDLAGKPELADRFLREIKVQANLDHPNIAKLYTAARVDNQLVMFMEFVEGVSLAERVRQGRVPIAQAADYAGQVLSALEYAHQQGIVHRDIKPANMMLTPAGAVKLMDFGIAKAAAEPGLTGTGMTLGSLYYMSPEQIQGTDVDARSDLYAVGVSLYEMVTGKRPFDGTSQFSIMSAHLEKPPIAPSEIERDIPPALSELILMAVNRDPASRFQTAGAFRNALRSMQPQSPPLVAAPLRATVPPPPAAAPIVVADAPKSHRLLWVTAGGICAVLVIVAFIAFGPRHKTSASGPPPAEPQAATPSTPVPAAVPPSAQSIPTPVASTPAAEVPPPVSHPAETPRQPVKPAVRTDTAPSQAAAPAPAPTPAPPAPSVAATPPPANARELEQAREQFTQLDARAESIRGTLQSFQRSQASQGLSLRGDWVRAGTLMDSYLRQADSALNAGNAASAKDYLEKAERQTETLEKALNK